LRLCSVCSGADPCASSDTRFSGSAPIKARPSNAEKIYASAGGEQPHIERNKDLQCFWVDTCCIDNSNSNEAASLESKLKAEWDAHMGTVKKESAFYQNTAVLLTPWHTDIDDLDTGEEVRPSTLRINSN
jgi:hypothetical protein